MKHPIQISIPQPCHEDWNKMTPQKQGRFCDNCQKCVVDFTGFTDEELYKYFTKNKGKKICSKGRYASIDSETVRISDGNEIRTLYIIDGIRIINTKEINNRESIEFVEPPIHGLPAKYSNYNNER